MAKLAVVALAFAALVALATAQTTIVTTTIHDDNPVFGMDRQCRQQLQGRQFDQCRMFLQQPQSSFQEQFPQSQEGLLQQCCQQLQNVDDQCQCQAVKQVFREAQQQQQGQQFQPFSGHQQTQQLKQKAQQLPNICNLRSRQCSIGRITTSVTQEDNPFGVPSIHRPFGSQQQCSQSDIQRPVQQCQRYVSQQVSSPRTLLMSFDRRQGHQQELRQCCEELQNVQRDCQCPALVEVAQRVMQQQQHQQQGRFFGGEKTEIVRRVVENLPNECKLDVQQCSIPSPY